MRSQGALIIPDLLIKVQDPWRGLLTVPGRLPGNLYTFFHLIPMHCQVGNIISSFQMRNLSPERLIYFRSPSQWQRHSWNWSLQFPIPHRVSSVSPCAFLRISTCDDIFMQPAYKCFRERHYYLYYNCAFQLPVFSVITFREITKLPVLHCKSPCQPVSHAGSSTFLDLHHQQML